MAQKTKPKPEAGVSYVGFYMGRLDVERLKRAASAACRSMSAQARLLVLRGLEKEAE